MKSRTHVKKLSALALASILSASSLLPVFGAEKLSRVSPGVYQLFQEGDTVSGVLHRGVDLSHWQGTVDWNTVAKHDVDFVFLGTRYAGEVDPLFRENAEGAERNGIRIGVYIYSYASSVEMAEKEADFVLDLIKDYPISYPVVFDAENDDTLGSLPKAEITRIVNAFCGKIRDAGYYPILYANDYWLSEVLDMNALSGYPVWCAAYERLPKWENYVIWQGTETGSIPGIEGSVDIDLQFRDFSSQIPADGWKKFKGESYYYQNYRMAKNRLINDGTHSYYMDSDGKIFTGGWKTVENRNRYFSPSDGVMQTGIAEVDGKRYFFLEDGTPASGWAELAGNWYYTGSDGVIQTGVVNVNERLYSLGSDGVMLHDTETAYQGAVYVIDSSGIMSLKPAEQAENAEAASSAAPAEASPAETVVPADPSQAVSSQADSGTQQSGGSETGSISASVGTADGALMVEALNMGGSDSSGSVDVSAPAGQTGPGGQSSGSESISGTAAEPAAGTDSGVSTVQPLTNSGTQQSSGDSVNGPGAGVVQPASAL